MSLTLSTARLAEIQFRRTSETGPVVAAIPEPLPVTVSSSRHASQRRYTSAYRRTPRMSTRRYRRPRWQRGLCPSLPPRPQSSGRGSCLKQRRGGCQNRVPCPVASLGSLLLEPRPGEEAGTARGEAQQQRVWRGVLPGRSVCCMSQHTGCSNSHRRSAGSSAPGQGFGQ